MSQIIRLHITVEGDTEKRFVDDVLRPYLAHKNIFTDARKVLTKKDKRAHREYRGGYAPYERIKKDIQSWMSEDNNQECRFATMFDLYALGDDFPSFSVASNITDAYKRVVFLEEAFKQDMNEWKFIPYIQLHEFEALIFSDPSQMDWEYLEHSEQIKHIIQMVDEEGGNPELINCGVDTAPSKRILAEIPEYDKYNAGPSILQKIGLEQIRAKCKHFDMWLSELEKLSQ